MPLFQPTEYLRPSTADEAASVLRKHVESARVIGGGTQLYELAERGLLSDITTLVDLGRLRFDKVGREGPSLRIGATVSLSELERHEEVLRHPGLGAVLDALRSIHPVQVKNLATVAGAVCSSISFFDLPVGLAALDAKVEIRGEQGRTRERPVIDFMVDFLTTELAPGEFVTSLTLEPESYTTSAFAKFSLTGNDWALVNCGCSLKIENGVIASAGIVFGGLSGNLSRAVKTGERVRGLADGSGTGLEEAIETLDSELKNVVSDYRASAEYRRKLAKVLLREALHKALSRERGVTRP